jgi:hypothetical protein
LEQPSGWNNTNPHAIHRAEPFRRKAIRGHPRTPPRPAVSRSRSREDVTQRPASIASWRCGSAAGQAAPAGAGVAGAPTPARGRGGERRPRLGPESHSSACALPYRSPPRLRRDSSGVAATARRIRLAQTAGTGSLTFGVLASSVRKASAMRPIPSAIRSSGMLEKLSRSVFWWPPQG